MLGAGPIMLLYTVTHHTRLTTLQNVPHQLSESCDKIFAGAAWRSSLLLRRACLTSFREFFEAQAGSRVRVAQHTPTDRNAGLGLDQETLSIRCSVQSARSGNRASAECMFAQAADQDRSIPGSFSRVSARALPPSTVCSSAASPFGGNRSGQELRQSCMGAPHAMP